MAAEHARGDRVEGAEPRHALDRAAARCWPTRSLHFARGLVGEGDGEDLAGPGLAGRDQMGEARGQRGGLAGARAGEHQDRALGRQHGLALGRVEALEIGGFGINAGRFRHLAEVGGGERNGNRRRAIPAI